MSTGLLVQSYFHVFVFGVCIGLLVARLLIGGMADE